MEYNGVNSGDQTDIAQMLNSYFTEIGPNLGRDLTEVDKSFEEFFTRTDKNFVFEKTTPTHVFALLSKLCKSKATYNLYADWKYVPLVQLNEFGISLQLMF